MSAQIGRVWLQAGGIPVPEDAMPSIGTWTCPVEGCGFTIGPIHGTPYCTLTVECPIHGTHGEIIPLPEERTDG